MTDCTECTHCMEKEIFPALPGSCPFITKKDGEYYLCVLSGGEIRVSSTAIPSLFALPGSVSVYRPEGAAADPFLIYYEAEIFGPALSGWYLYYVNGEESRLCCLRAATATAKGAYCNPLSIASEEPEVFGVRGVISPCILKSSGKALLFYGLREYGKAGETLLNVYSAELENPWSFSPPRLIYSRADNGGAFEISAASFSDGLVLVREDIGDKLAFRVAGASSLPAKETLITYSGPSPSSRISFAGEPDRLYAAFAARAAIAEYVYVCACEINGGTSISPARERPQNEQSGQRKEEGIKENILGSTKENIKENTAENIKETKKTLKEESPSKAKEAVKAEKRNAAGKKGAYAKSADAAKSLPYLLAAGAVIAAAVIFGKRKKQR